MQHKLESRLPGEISISSDMRMKPPLWQKVKRNYKAHKDIYRLKVRGWKNIFHAKKE